MLFVQTKIRTNENNKNMASLKISFVSVGSSISIYEYEVPEKVQKEIMESKSLLSGFSEFVISFSRIGYFNKDHYYPIINYVLTELPSNIEKVKIGEDEDSFQYTFKLKHEDFLEQLQLDDLIFLTAIVDRLNLKDRLIVIAQIAMEKYSVTFEFIKEKVKDNKYDTNIFWC